MASRKSHLLVLAYIAFISLGLPDGLIGVAWPSIKADYRLHQGSLGVAFLCSGTGYFLSSFFMGQLLQRIGTGSLLALSSALVSAGLWGIAAVSGWPVFVVSAFVIGLGSGAIDAGLNTHAAAHFSVRHVNWLHACFGVGAMIGPLIMTGVLVRDLPWQSGYAFVGGLMLLMTLLFRSTRSVWDSRGAPDSGGGRAVRTRDVLKQPLVWMLIAIFFVYTGLEVTVGQWSFTLNVESRGLSEGTAGTWTGLYWGGLGLGRFLLVVLIERLGADRLLRLAFGSILLGCVLLAFGRGILGLFGLLLIGFSLAPVFPTLISRMPDRTGPAYAAHAIGFMVSAAMLGSAVIPSMTGWLIEYWGLEIVGKVAIAGAVILWLLHECLLRVSISE